MISIFQQAQGMLSWNALTWRHCGKRWLKRGSCRYFCFPMRDMEGSAIFVLFSFSFGLFPNTNACFSHLCLPSALPQGLTLFPHTALLPRLCICSKFSSDGLRARKETGVLEDCNAAERCSLAICAWKDCFWRLKHAEMIMMCCFLSTGHLSASSQHFWEHSGVMEVLCSWWMESMRTPALSLPFISRHGL